MEGELWKSVYGIVREIDRTWNHKHQQYTDGCVVETYLWAVLHDRPTSWACRTQHWP